VLFGVRRLLRVRAVITPLNGIFPGYSWWPGVGPNFGPPTPGRAYKYPRPVVGWDMHNEKLQFPPVVLSVSHALSLSLSAWVRRPVKIKVRKVQLRLNYS
jgi:hypothetical protein